MGGGNRRIGWGPGVAFALALLLSWHPAAPAEDLRGRPAKEYQVKAVFLYHFVQFVQWPPEAFPKEDSPLVIGVLGKDPFDTYLVDVVKGETVGAHPLRVARYGSLAEVQDCHLLFVSASETPRMESILRALGGRRILTVGESEQFCRMGGMVALLTRGGKVRLKINLEAVQASGLTVSSKLLRLAEIYTKGKG